MKMFNFKRLIVFALVAVMVSGMFSMSTAAAQVDTTGTDMSEAVALASAAGYQLDSETKVQLEAIVKEAVSSLDIAEAEKVDPEKSTFVAIQENPVKVVKYDGKGHGLKAAAYKTVSLKYVADAKVLYVGMTKDGTIYRSFNKPVEVGFYYAVCMYGGNGDNYPSVSYGIVLILPACEPCPPTDPDEPSKEDPAETESSKEETTADESSEEETTIDESSKEETTADESSEEETTTDESSEEETTADESSEEETTIDESSEDEMAADESTNGGTAADESTTDESVTGEAAADESATESSAVEEATETAAVTDKDSIETGDSTQAVLYAVASVVALAGAAVVLKKKFF